MNQETARALERAERVLPQQREALLSRLLDLTERQQQNLEEAAAKAPESARPALERALLMSRRGHERAREALEKARGAAAEKRQPGPPRVGPQTDRDKRTPATEKQKREGPPRQSPNEGIVSPLTPPGQALTPPGMGR